MVDLLYVNTMPVTLISGWFIWKNGLEAVDCRQQSILKIYIVLLGPVQRHIVQSDFPDLHVVTAHCVSRIGGFVSKLDVEVHN